MVFREVRILLMLLATSSVQVFGEICDRTPEDTTKPRSAMRDKFQLSVNTYNRTDSPTTYTPDTKYKSEYFVFSTLESWNSRDEFSLKHHFCTFHCRILFTEREMWVRKTKWSELRILIRAKNDPIGFASDFGWIIILAVQGFGGSTKGKWFIHLCRNKFKPYSLYSRLLRYGITLNKMLKSNFLYFFRSLGLNLSLDNLTQLNSTKNFRSLFTPCHTLRVQTPFSICFSIKRCLTINLPRQMSTVEISPLILR